MKISCRPECLFKANCASPIFEHLYIYNPATLTHFEIKLHTIHFFSIPMPQVLVPDCDDKNDDDDGIDELDGARPSLGLRGGPCGDVTAAEVSDSTSEDDNNPLSTSLEAKYFSQSFHREQDDSDDGWNHCPDNLEQEFQRGSWLLFLNKYRGSIMM